MYPMFMVWCDFERQTLQHINGSCGSAGIMKWGPYLGDQASSQCVVMFSDVPNSALFGLVSCNDPGSVTVTRSTFACLAPVLCQERPAGPVASPGVLKRLQIDENFIVFEIRKPVGMMLGCIIFFHTLCDIAADIYAYPICSMWLEYLLIHEWCL